MLGERLPKTEVLVVTEDWAGPRPNDSSPTKKVVSLTDDTDAKSAGDDTWPKEEDLVTQTECQIVFGGGRLCLFRQQDSCDGLCFSVCLDGG